MKAISRKFDEDMIEIMEVVTEKLKEKYIFPFQEMVRTRNECLKENPVPEVALLNALKPFVDNRCCDIIDKLISSYNVATLSRIILEDFQQAKAGAGKIDLQEISSKTANNYRHRPNKLSILLPLIFLLIFGETH